MGIPSYDGIAISHSLVTIKHGISVPSYVTNEFHFSFCPLYEKLQYIETERVKKEEEEDDDDKSKFSFKKGIKQSSRRY